MTGLSAELMYPSHVIKFTSLSDGQHEAQNGTITYLMTNEIKDRIEFLFFISFSCCSFFLKHKTCTMYSIGVVHK